MAHVMLRVGNVKAGDTICDPFCGSGTILMEAADWLNGNVTCIGMDVNRKAIEGAKKNVAARPGKEILASFGRYYFLVLTDL
jgi:tRNA G10  N-methylase Trm11